MSENLESPNLISEFLRNVILPTSVEKLEDCRKYYKEKVDELENELIEALKFVVNYEYENKMITNSEEKFATELKTLDSSMQESLNILLERCSKLFPEEGLLLAEDEQKQIDDFIENFDRLSEELRLTLNDFNEAIATSRENSVIYLIAKNNLFLSYSKLNITIESINSFVKENQELKNTVFLGSFFKAANSKFLGIKDLLEEASAKLNIQVTENSEATNLSTDDNYSTELHSGAQEDSKLELTGEDSN